MKKLFQLLSLAFVLVYVPVQIYAQDTRPAKIKQKSPKKSFFSPDSIYYGGNLGLQLGTGGSLIDISPNAGYKFNKFLSLGTQIIFTNISYKYSGFTYRYMFYGGGAFIRIKPLNFLFLQAEYDVLSVPDAFSVTTSKRTIADVNLAGVGFRSQMGENSCYYLLAMYEFVPTPNSPYTYGPFGSPLVFRAGFNVNF